MPRVSRHAAQSDIRNLMLLSIFADNLMPIFVVAGIGFLLARYLHTSVQTMSRLALNVLSPFLIFNTLATSRVNAGEFGRMALFSICVILGVGLVAQLLTRLLRLDRATASAFVIVVTFSNAGNYGLPLVLFAFGQEALAYATIYFIINIVLMYTVGVLVAASGQGSIRRALSNLVRMPNVYAVVAAAVLLVTRASLAAPVMRPIQLLSDATLPVMILVLGMQLERATIPERPWLVGAASILRLVVVPVLALVLSAAFRLSGVDRQAAVMQSSMPAAVMATVLALEYQSAPAFVTAVVFLSTILSPFTLTPLIAFLQR